MPTSKTAALLLVVVVFGLSDMMSEGVWVWIMDAGSPMIDPKAFVENFLDETENIFGSRVSLEAIEWALRRGLDWKAERVNLWAASQSNWKFLGNRISVYLTEADAVYFKLVE